MSETSSSSRSLAAERHNALTATSGADGKMRYKDLSWRLDTELARRNISSKTEPKYMLRLDVYDGGSEDKPRVKSMHLQADFANMKRLQTELQRALAELGAPHAQRLTRYIK